MVDADSNTPLLHGRDSGRSYAPDEELAKTLVHTLEPVAGADHVRASVHVEYDLGTSEETLETYDPKTATALTQEHSEESSVGEAPAGVPGTASNVPTPPAPLQDDHPAPSPGCGERRAFHVEVGFDHLRHQQELHRSVEPAGRVRRIAAAVLVDDAVDWTEKAGKKTQHASQADRRGDERDRGVGQGLDRSGCADGEMCWRWRICRFRRCHWKCRRRPPRPNIGESYLSLGPGYCVTSRSPRCSLVIYILILRPVKKQALAAFRELPGKLHRNSSTVLAPAGGRDDA